MYKARDNLVCAFYQVCHHYPGSSDIHVRHAHRCVNIMAFNKRFIKSQGKGHLLVIDLPHKDSPDVIANPEKRARATWAGIPLHAKLAGQLNHILVGHAKSI